MLLALSSTNSNCLVEKIISEAMITEWVINSDPTQKCDKITRKCVQFSIRIFLSTNVKHDNNWIILLNQLFKIYSRNLLQFIQFTNII